MTDLPWSVFQGLFQEGQGLIIRVDRRIGGEVEWVRGFLESVEEEVLKWDIGGGGAFNHSAVYWRKRTKDRGKLESKKLDGENAVEAAFDDIKSVNI